jgi:hypothetical protein
MSIDPNIAEGPDYYIDPDDEPEVGIDICTHGVPFCDECEECDEDEAAEPTPEPAQGSQQS